MISSSEILYPDKPSCRRAIRALRQGISHSIRLKNEQRVASFASCFIRRNRRVGAYLAMGSELSLEPLIRRALKCRARIFLPVIPLYGRRLWFTRLDSFLHYQRQKNYNLLECKAKKRVRAAQLDVIFIPLIAVDREGFRLGQGGGFYDVSLHSVSVRRPLRVGVAFDCQRVPKLPRDDWDLALDWLITPSGLTHFRANLPP